MIDLALAEAEELNICEHKHFYHYNGYKVSSGNVDYFYDSNIILYVYDNTVYGVDVTGLEKPCEWFEKQCHKAKYALERKLIDFALDCASGELVYHKFNEGGSIELKNGSVIRLKYDKYVQYKVYGSLGHETFTSLYSFIWGHYYG